MPDDRIPQPARDLACTLLVGAAILLLPAAAAATPAALPASPSTAAPAADAASTPAPATASATELELAATALSWRFGQVALGDSGATLSLPRHFRFAPRSTLVRIAHLKGRPLPPTLLGWVVHERVELARPDAWYAEVHHQPLQQPVLPIDPGLTDPERAAAEAAYVARIAEALHGESPLEAPLWDAAAAQASWQRPDAVEASTRADSVAVRLLPAGLLAYLVPALPAAHRELGERTVRLLAHRTRTPAL